MSDLLAHLTNRLATHPENIATEALTYLLRKSEPARQAVVELAASLGSKVVLPLDFRSQDGIGGSGTPDVVGLATDGTQQPFFLLEAKFWAGLTEHQPVSYMKKLASGGCLLFVVPSVRASFVWAAIQQRVQDAQLTSVLAASGMAAQVTVSPNTVITLALSTWEALVNSLSRAVNAAADKATLNDIEQLGGLCKRMDSEGFLPLDPAELSSGVWRRMTQMSDVIERVCDELQAQKIGEGLGRLSHGPAWSGYKTFALKGKNVNVGLYFDASFCATKFPTPFWLALPVAAQPYLAELHQEQPCRVFESKGAPYVALPIRTGVERDDVVSDVVKHCARIAKLFPDTVPGSVAITTSAPAPTDDVADPPANT